MNGNPHADDAPFLVAGRLEGASLPELLWTLCRERKTGVLQLSSAERKKSVFIEDGRIVFASSSDPDDRLGELLLRQGTVRLDQLEHALLKLHSGKRLGTLLVEAGSLTPEELVRGVLAQVESIVLGLFTWNEGAYHFREGPLPTDEVITLGMRTAEILLRGIRRIRSMNRIRRSVGAPHQWYGLTPGWREILDGLTLTVGEELLIERLRDGDVSVEDLCNEVFLSNFEIYQTLWGFKMLGVIREKDSPRDTTIEATEEGSLQQVGFDELLVRLGRDRETGVLYVSRPNLERTFHIRDGRCVFATSDDPEDSLLAFLLRRGVISLRDREETAKRLLSNKRVGTILRELGVIDEQDLREMVRQQIGEIVYDTFAWSDAHFAFVAGPLPSNEEITLEESLDRLVAQGLRRVTSWTRVIRGCGGLDSRLALQPTYLDVLDAMSAGADEWSVIASLKEPRTPKEICRSTELGSFRVCQILWGLRVLGALSVHTAGAPVLVEAPAEETPEMSADARRIEVVDLDEAAVPPAEEAERDAAAEVVEEQVTDEEPEPEAVAEAADEPVTDEEREPEAELPALDATQVVPRELIEASLAATAESAEPVEPSADTAPADTEEEIEEPVSTLEEPDMTQVISPELVERSLQAESSPDIEPGAGAGVRHGAGRIVSAEPPRPPLPQTDEEPQGFEGFPEHGGAGATQVIPRDVIDEALAARGAEGPEEESLGEAEAADDAAAAGEEAGQAAPESEEAGEAEPAVDEPEFEPSPDLNRMIERFNAKQRLVYRAIRTEVGAGAVNFIRSCCGQLSPDASDSLHGAEIRADGSWDAEGLRRAAVEHRIDDPWPGYEALIQIEIDLLREHLGDARVLELQQRMETVDAGSAAEP